MTRLLLSTAVALAFAVPAAAQDLRIAVSTHINNMDPSRQWGNVAQPTLRPYTLSLRSGEVTIDAKL